LAELLINIDSGDPPQNAVLASFFKRKGIAPSTILKWLIRECQRNPRGKYWSG